MGISSTTGNEYMQQNTKGANQCKFQVLLIQNSAAPLDMLQ